MNKKIVAGVDIGGSHITASLVDLEDGLIIPSSVFRTEVDSSASAEGIAAQWCSTIAESFSANSKHQNKIGIAMPGPVDYETGVCHIRDQNKYESLYGANLKELIAAGLDLDISDILMTNDAAGFLSGEVYIGAGKGHQKVIGLTLGTGLGSALFDKGVVTDADLWRSPFKEGIAENYISAPWLLKTAKRVTGFDLSDVKQMALKASTDEALAEIFKEFGNNLGHFLAAQIKLHKPEMIIMGGNVSKAHRLFKSSIEKTLAEQGIYIPLSVAEMGESAALFGAASLWKDHLSVASFSAKPIS